MLLKQHIDKKMFYMNFSIDSQLELEFILNQKPKSLS